MKTPLPEALDKLSILMLKMERLPDEQVRAMVKREHDFYLAVVNAYKKDGVEVKDEWLQGLYEVNGRCWDIESAIRQGRDDELGFEEIGRRAVQLRDLNRERIALKNRVAQDIGIDFFEIKIDHASE